MQQITPEQHGYTKSKPTRTRMILYLSEIYEKLDMHKLATFYLEFEKTFDKECGVKLLKKLRSFGVAAGALKLLKSYPSQRREAKKIFEKNGDAISSELIVSNGMPKAVS